MTTDLAKKLLNDKNAYLTEEGKKQLEKIVKN